jgi:hypothetical protein
MVFTKGLREGVRRGRIRCSVRIWKNLHVKVGGRYPMDEGHIVVDSVASIEMADITDGLARESGFKSADDLLQTARHGSGDNVYLIRFHYLAPGAWDIPPARGEAGEDRETLLRRIRTSTPPRKGANGAKRMMMSMSKEKNVDTYVRSLAPGKRAMVQTLRRLVKKQAPHLVEVMKWGNVCWVGKGNVCLIHVEDDHLDFGFFYGASLPDPHGILVGNGKFVRVVKVRKAADIRPRALAGLVASAVSFDGPAPNSR